jgi:hypothetical protein
LPAAQLVQPLSDLGSEHPAGGGRGEDPLIVDLGYIETSQGRYQSDHTDRVMYNVDLTALLLPPFYIAAGVCMMGIALDQPTRHSLISQSGAASNLPE